MESSGDYEKLKFARNFEDLVVFRRAYRVSLDVHKATVQFLPREQVSGLGDQMRRASKGICANLAEGFGKNAYASEMRRFVMMALGSSEEMRVWIRYALDLGLIDEKTWQVWRDDYLEISAMLRSLAKAKKAR